MNNDFNNPFLPPSEDISYTQESNDFNNPFFSPSEDISYVQESNDEMCFLGEPRNIPASNWIGWVEDAWQLFKEQPLMWSMAILLCGIIMFVISLISFLCSTPIIGGVLLIVILPIFTAGFMLACHQQYNTGYFDIANIFSGFKKGLPQLLILSIFPLILMAITFFYFVHIPSNKIAFEILNGSKNVKQFIPAGDKKYLVILGILSYTYAAALYLAPALIIINDMSAIDALKQSYKASCKYYLNSFSNRYSHAEFLGIRITFAILVIILFNIASYLPSDINLMIFTSISIVFAFCAISMKISMMYLMYLDVFYGYKGIFYE